MSCCPAGSEKFLASENNAHGSVVHVSESTECFLLGTVANNNVIVVIPDIFGWNGGRIRNIGEQFVKAGYCAIIPKLMAPGFEGGTDGDALPADCDLATRGAEVWPYLKTFSWTEKIRPAISDVISYLKSNGAKSFATVGFCWGGWAIAHMVEEFGDDFKAAVIPHPSNFNVANLHGEDPVANVRKLRIPTLLIPAGNDPDMYRTGGELLNAMKEVCPESESTDHAFDEVVHGFVPRGDINNEVVRKNVEDAIARTLAFINRHM